MSHSGVEGIRDPPGQSSVFLGFGFFTIARNCPSCRLGCRSSYEKLPMTSLSSLGHGLFELPRLSTYTPWA